MAAGDTLRRIGPQDQFILDSSGSLVGVKSPNANGNDLRLDPSALPFTGATTAFLGDSRVAQGGGSTTGSTLAKNWNFPFHVGNALMGQRMVDVGNFGNSGDRSDQVLSRLAAALATRPAFLWIQCGTNDIFQGAGGVNDAGIFANIQAMAQAALAQGTRPILVTETGATAYGANATKIGYTHALNQRLREYAARTPNVILFDLASVTALPTSTGLAFRTNYDVGDGQHLSNLGGFVAGQAFQTLMSSLVPAVQSEIVSASDLYANGGRQLLDDPLFSVTTGGTVGTGITGPVPGQWNAQRTGSATATVTTGANASGYGNDVSVACAFTAAGEQVTFAYGTNLNARLTAGDIIQFIVDVTVSSPVNIKGIAARLDSNVGSTGYQPWDGYNTLNGIGPGAGFTATLATPPWQVPSGVINYVLPTIQMEASAGSASGTMVIRRVKCIKRFAL